MGTTICEWHGKLRGEELQASRSVLNAHLQLINWIAKCKLTNISVIIKSIPGIVI